MKQKYVFYEIAKNNLSQRLKRIAGAHRLGNISQSQMQTQQLVEFENTQTQIHAYEARRRIPAELKGTTFYGMNDWWNYFKSYAPNMCHNCDFFGDIKFFNGTDIRGTFPNQVILDENTIEPNVHPHCGCYMLRVFPEES